MIIERRPTTGLGLPSLLYCLLGRKWGQKRGWKGAEERAEEGGGGVEWRESVSRMYQGYVLPYHINISMANIWDQEKPPSQPVFDQVASNWVKHHLTFPDIGHPINRVSS